MGRSIFNTFNLSGYYHKLRPGERSFLLGALVTILLLILDVAVVRPLWDYYISMEERTAAEERKLVRNLLNINRKDLVEKDYEEYMQYIHPSGTDEEEIGKLLSEIEQKARSNKVVLVDMKPRETKQQDFYKEYRAELDAETDMANWVQFVHQLEESDQLIRLTAFKLARKGVDLPIVKAKMEVTKTLILEKP